MSESNCLIYGELYLLTDYVSFYKVLPVENNRSRTRKQQTEVFGLNPGDFIIFVGSKVYNDMIDYSFLTKDGIGYRINVSNLVQKIKILNGKSSEPEATIRD